jgi:hypothetical protein
MWVYSGWSRNSKNYSGSLIFKYRMKFALGILWLNTVIKNCGYCFQVKEKGRIEIQSRVNPISYEKPFLPVQIPNQPNYRVAMRLVYPE